MATKYYLAFKDVAQTLSNKTIDADSNTIQNLEVDNLKNSSVSTAIPSSGGVDTKLTTEKAVRDAIDPIAPSVTEDGTLFFGLLYIPINTYADLITAMETENELPLKLVADLTATSTIFADKTNTIDLNGHNITGNNTFRFLEITDATITLTGNGEISNFRHTEYRSTGGCIYISSEGTFTMNGGTISGCSAIGGTRANGGGVYVDSGTFIMNDGAISGCVTTCNEPRWSNGEGGGVYLSGGIFIMNGGTISGCTTTGESNVGGGLYFDTISEFNWLGGTIINNTPDNVYPHQDPPSEA